mmetsp:Transcript_17321/g.23926  ORF Transcript_17321/g.23926 Transcript_17321/m.23926 type:complete len:104 (+) Transcript_17321:1-312(+)
MRLVSDPTLAQVERKFPGMLPPHIGTLYRRFLRNHASVRRWWSTSGGVTTLVHGDAHVGNMFFRTDQSCGLYDWQRNMECEMLLTISFPPIRLMLWRQRRKSS